MLEPILSDAAVKPSIFFVLFSSISFSFGVNSSPNFSNANTISPKFK